MKTPEINPVTVRTTTNRTTEFPTLSFNIFITKGCTSQIKVLSFLTVNAVFVSTLTLYAKTNINADKGIVEIKTFISAPKLYIFAIYISKASNIKHITIIVHIFNL